MSVESIISIINATGDTVSHIIFQVAMFFAIQQASTWLSITFPCLLLYGLFLRIAGGAATSESPLVGLKVAAYILLAVTLFTGVRGASHILQAAVSPSVYVASEIGAIDKIIQGTKK